MLRRIASHPRGASGTALTPPGFVALVVAGSHDCQAQTCGAEADGYFSIVDDRVSGSMSGRRHSGRRGSLIRNTLGAGAGTVTSMLAGIACGATCGHAYTPGTVVTLAQAAMAGSVFTGWSGACTGKGECWTTMNAAQTVNATFTQGIAVTVPSGGETWSRNSTSVIRWNYLGSPGAKVKIELLKNGAVSKTIASSTSTGSGGAGTYSWKVPSNQAPGADYRIRVTSTTASGYADTSDANFTIN